MNKNNFSSPNSNFINLQEFDDIFHSSSLPKSSRQTSMSLKSKVSSEPPQDFDEDFSAINNLIHQRVNEPSTSQPNSYFKDSPFFDTANIFRVPKLSSETSNNPINDPQIANILAEPPISSNRPEPSYFQMGSNPMPEGWLNLFRSLQSEPPGLSPATGSRQGTKKSLRLSKDFESWDATASSSWTGSNQTSTQVDMKELEDQSNPYKIKSKKELEEERKKKEQLGQAQPAAKKPVQQELRHAKSNVEKTSGSGRGSSASVINKPEESDIHRTKKQYNESGYNKYNNGYTEPSQTKSATPKANLDTPVNKKNTERYTEPVVAKVTTPKNVPVNETPVVTKKTKQQPQKPAIEEKIPTPVVVNKEPLKQNIEKPKVEEVVKKPKEEIKPEVKAKEHKETKKDVIKQPEPVISKPVIEKATQVKSEKPVTVVEKEVVPKQQEPEKVPVKDKKQPEQPKPQPQAAPQKKAKEEKVVVKAEPVKPEPEPVVEEEETSEPRSSVEQEKSISGGKGQAEEEFITIGTSKKKKGKKAEKAESKKQILKEVVKKETEKLIQNPFSALQTSNNPPTSSKEPKEKEPVVEIVEPKVKEEPALMPTLQAENSSSSATKDKKEKSKKQKKAEKKKAEEAQKAQKAAAAEVKEEKKEEQPPAPTVAAENIPTEEKTLSSETVKGKNKKKGQANKAAEEIPEVKPVEPENKPASVEEDSAKEDEGEEKADAAGQPSKNKKKKNKKKKNKNKEENAEQGIIGSSTTQTKADNRKAAVENDGSTDEDEPGTEKKSEQQFSKSKKKKLKKKAKQQPLFECIRNAENKFLEFLNEYFLEPNGVPDDVAFMEKFKKVLAMQKSMQLELKPAKPSKEVKEIKEIRDPKTKTTIVKERIEEKGPFGETRIKLQVTLRRHNEEEELSEKEKKKKDRRNRSSINEVFENPGDEFDALKKLISEDMGDKRTQNVPSLMNSRQDFDNVKEAIEHVESIVKNKSEVQQIRNRKVETEDLSSLPLHELLERVENRRFRFQEDEEELDCPLTMN